MPDQEKIAKEDEKDKPQASIDKKSDDKNGQKEGPALTQEKTSDQEEAKPEKTAIEEVAVEAKAPKGKKGKSEYKELKPEEIKSGMIVRVHQKIKETNPKGEEKERTQVFQGMVIAHKHGQEAGSSITVRKVSEGVGVEKIFPLNMPSISKIELVRKYSVRQARPYFLRTYKKRLTEVKE